jgi:hypothetical protein
MATTAEVRQPVPEHYAGASDRWRWSPFHTRIWWLSTDVPVRSFLESGAASRVLKGKPFTTAVCCRRYYWKHNLKTVRRLGTKHGGVLADGINYQGGQICSLLSLLSYLGSGEYREKYLGIKIPPANIQDHHLQEARKSADGLANRLAGNTPVKAGRHMNVAAILPNMGSSA